MLEGFVTDPLKKDHLAVLRQMVAAAAAARKFQRICYSHDFWFNKCCGTKSWKPFSSFKMKMRSGFQIHNCTVVKCTKMLLVD